MRRAGVDGRTALFGEGPGGVVVSGPRDALLELSRNAAGVGFLALGAVGGDASGSLPALLRSTSPSRTQEASSNLRLASRVS